MSAYKCRKCGEPIDSEQDSVNIVCGSCGEKQCLSEMAISNLSERVSKLNSDENDSFVAPLLERTVMFLEDGKWNEADGYCERILDREPKNSMAYLLKMMAELKINSVEMLIDVENTFENNDNCIKAGRFDSEIAEDLKNINDFIREKNEEKFKTEETYRRGLSLIEKYKSSHSRECLAEAVECFRSIQDYKDSSTKMTDCMEMLDYHDSVIVDREEAEAIKKEFISAKNIAVSVSKKYIVVSLSVVCGIIALIAVVTGIEHIFEIKNIMKYDNFVFALRICMFSVFPGILLAYFVPIRLFNKYREIFDEITKKIPMSVYIAVGIFNIFIATYFFVSFIVNPLNKFFNFYYSVVFAVFAYIFFMQAVKKWKRISK